MGHNNVTFWNRRSWYWDITRWIMGKKQGHFLRYWKMILVYLRRWSYGRFKDGNNICNKMKNDLTTGTWQDDIWCPIFIILFCTSDVLFLLASRKQPSCQLSGWLAPATDTIAATLDDRIIRASCWRHDGLNEFLCNFLISVCTHNSICEGIIVLTHRVFGKEWIDLISPTSPHSVFQPTWSVSKKNQDKREENDGLD